MSSKNELTQRNTQCGKLCDNMFRSHLYKYTHNISLMSGFFSLFSFATCHGFGSCERAHGVNAASCATRVSLASLRNGASSNQADTGLTLPPEIEHVSRVAGFQGLGLRHTGECARNARNAREIAARARSRAGGAERV